MRRIPGLGFKRSRKALNRDTRVGTETDGVELGEERDVEGRKILAEAQAERGGGQRRMESGEVGQKGGR
eukprot:408543-Rhodomonas_salina.1